MMRVDRILLFVCRLFAVCMHETQPRPRPDAPDRSFEHLTILSSPRSRSARERRRRAAR